MDYHLAIPTHRRAVMLGQKTLKFLALSGAPKPTLYVGDEQDRQEYSVLYPDLEIHIAPKGIAATRNFVQDTQPLGSKIVFIDDDIEEVVHLDLSYPLPLKQRKVKVRNFDSLIQEGFECARRAGASWWGVQPTDNLLNLKPVIRRNLSYINGSLFGVINTRVSVIENHLEDFERCLCYWVKEGVLCRLEFVGLVTKYLKNPGGLQETRDEVMTSQSALNLVERYPTLCKLRKKKGKWSDLSYKRFPANFLPAISYNTEGN